jgi:hypothetical protein
MTLLGATAIEGRLQIGVPATIEALLDAHINISSGAEHKRDTAIHIRSLRSPDLALVQIGPKRLVADIQQMLTSA